MSTESGRTHAGGLQFDTADTSASSASDRVSCSRCGKELREYFHVDGAVMCGSCRDVAVRDAAPERSWSRVALAALFGAGAAIAGAIVYYGVIAITDFEIGIVALLIGFMVGWAVRKGAGGRGGRRFQVLAIALTYFSVGLAYSPLAFKASFDAEKQRQSADSTAITQAGTPADSARSATGSTTAAIATMGTAADSTATGGSLALAFGALFLFIVALPVIAILGSMPSGILSAIIIGVGLQQAWRMTGAPAVSITGPYEVGPPAPPSPA